MKGINPHHWWEWACISWINKTSRICAYKVCGECSKKKVNGSRVCDLCYFRQKIEVHEKRREEYIRERGGMIVRAQVMLEKKGEELKHVGRKRSDLIEEVRLLNMEALVFSQICLKMFMPRILNLRKKQKFKLKKGYKRRWKWLKVYAKI